MNRAVLLTLALPLSTGLAPAPASAGGNLWVSVGLLGGVTQPDPDLSRYRWDVGARASWGAEVLVGSGGAGGGLRLRSWSTDQGTGLLEAIEPLSVGLTSVQLVARARMFSVFGTDLYGGCGVGRVHIGFHPDHLSFQPVGAPDPVEAQFRPLDEWMVSGELGLGREIGSGLTLGAGIEYSVFSIDTAHRNGEVIERSRERFGNWNLLVRLAWETRSL